MDHIVAAADGKQRQFLRSGVGHVGCDWRELLKEKEHTESDALRLPAKCKINSEHCRRSELQEGTSRHGNELAEPRKQKMTAFVHGNKNQIHRSEEHTSELQSP